MVESADLRAEWAGRGMAHIRTYHDERPALAILAELYGEAIHKHTRPARIPGKGVVFRNTKGRAVYDGTERIVFTDGLAEVTEPDVIDRLRGLRPSYGIVEQTEDVA